MKKILGLAVLMMVMLMSVSGLAQTTTSVSDTATVPVYLNVPEFVRLSVDPDDDDFSFTYDPADVDQIFSDTVALVAEANVSYTVIASEPAAEGGYGDWVDDELSISINSAGVEGWGSAGKVNFTATATLDLSGGLPAYDIIDGVKIAEVTFTIQSL